MFKSYKIRLFPTKEQEIMFYKHIGCCRSLWNFMLRYQSINHYLGGKYMHGFTMSNKLTLLKQKKKRRYLNEVSAVSLQIICSDLDKSYQRFFHKEANYPKRKSKKRSKKSFPINSVSFYFFNNTVNIEKIGKVKYKMDYKETFPDGKNIVKFINTRISLIDDKWLLTFTMECENQTDYLSGKMGIDMGIKSLATMAFYDECTKNESIDFAYNISKIGNIKRLECKLKHLRRKLSRKYRVHDNYKQTKNIEKTIKQIRTVERKIKNIRKDYIHKKTREYVDLNPEVVTMENLNIKGMLKNRRLSRNIQESCWGMFKEFMRYKCEQKGIKFQLAGRWFPSSKKCCLCGKKKKKLQKSLLCRLHHPLLCGDDPD